jgi:hypothetical protein
MFIKVVNLSHVVLYINRNNIISFNKVKNSPNINLKTRINCVDNIFYEVQETVDEILMQIPEDK